MVPQLQPLLLQPACLKFLVLTMVLTPIQIAMIVAIGEVHGHQLSNAAALSTLSAVSAGVAERTLSQFLVGWIPGYGNAINATTAFAITEAIGWAADKVLSEQER